MTTDTLREAVATDNVSPGLQAAIDETRRKIREAFSETDKIIAKRRLDATVRSGEEG